MTIYIASDHGGFELKKKIVGWLAEQGKSVVDMGPAALDPEDDYPVYAFPLAEKVAKNSDDIGILICRSGNGMAIAANKVKNVRAAVCFTPAHAQKARDHNNANILVLDADYQSESMHIEIVRNFLNSTFDAGRHTRRLQQIARYEAQHLR
ncbi:MAG: RpiB/LacA/LacB family sugar-phosphate isomerase [Candidatus Doudnabacteria bacterium]|nr:RpiB/LacA/LacB family sugar-phosphate isomerase [Candidatus Doudnabacteria bacterium]